MTEEDEGPVVLLIDASLPHPKCALSTNDFGTLILIGKQVTATSNNNTSLAGPDHLHNNVVIAPNVKSLALLVPAQPQDRRLDEESEPTRPITCWKELLIFPDEDDNDGDSFPIYDDADNKEFIELIKGMRWENLERASQVTTSTTMTQTASSLTSTPCKQESGASKRMQTKHRQHPLHDFLVRSEHVFQTFLQAVEQEKRRRKQDKSQRTKPLSSCSVEYLQALHYELERLEDEFGPNVIQQLEEPELRNLILRYDDVRKREHLLFAKFSYSMDEEPVYQHDVPSWEPPKWNLLPDGPLSNKRQKIQSDPSLSQRVTTTNNHIKDQLALSLVDVYQSFCAAVDKYQDVWNELEQLDDECRIIPETPARGFRRTIVVDSLVRIIVTLNTECPRSKHLSIRWTGTGCNIFKRRFEQHVQEADGWLETRSIRENLEHCLECSLRKQSQTPLGSTAAAAGAVAAQGGSDGAVINLVECGICYSHELEDDDDGRMELPSAKCEHLLCARSYHESCLKEWLQSLPSSRTSFDCILGSCPYCSEPIAVQLHGDV